MEGIGVQKPPVVERRTFGGGDRCSKPSVVERWTFGGGDRGSKPPVVERRTFGRGDSGPIPPAAVSKPGQFCPCLSEETLKAVGPFYLVSMPGEVKDPPQWVNV